ncbi:MAG: family 78 glycoside hydrolase catalytic domain, partial [Bifidobacteriaceae bacterium]|nr:family 78 glycoside hydrolase catalytic domain [Bifidobacteriaceae bacterium]
MNNLAAGGYGPGVPDDLAGAVWIARAVPRSVRTVRHLGGRWVDYAGPGHTLGQAFRADGPVVAVAVTLAPPAEPAYPSPVDVKYRVCLETPDGGLVAETAREGSSGLIMWERLAHMIAVDPPAPPGEYVVVLRPERGRIGWVTGEAPADRPGGAVSPAGKLGGAVSGADLVDDAVPPTSPVGGAAPGDPVGAAVPPGGPLDAAVAPGLVDDGVSPVPLVGRASSDGAPAPGVRVVGVDVVPAADPVFRRRFHLEGAPASARLALAVLGTGVVWVNGVKVGVEALGPALTDYARRVLYRTWDVAHLLRPGVNEIVVGAGRGWWAARGGDVWGWCFAPWHREPVVLARLGMGWPDGSESEVASDGRWECAAGPVESERLLSGEEWVVRAGEPGWGPVVVVAPPGGVLRRSAAPPVVARPAMPPRVVERLDAGRRVFDFSEVVAGRVRCRVSGGTGGLVRVKYGEWRDAAGAVVCHNPYIAGQAQVDSLRLERAVEDHVWEPQFGYRGFRWVEVETSGDVAVEDVRAVPLYTDLERVGELRCGEPVLEWIDQATAKTFLNNLHGIPTDTPTYEQNGWTDLHNSLEALVHHFDLRGSLTEWLESHMDAQSADGSVPWIVPT